MKEYHKVSKDRSKNKLSLRKTLIITEKVWHSFGISKEYLDYLLSDSFNTDMKCSRLWVHYFLSTFGMSAILTCLKYPQCVM